MVNVESDDVVVRDYSRVAKVLIAIGLRIIEDDEECDDESDPGLRASVN